jgi:hypothetical protein
MPVYPVISIISKNFWTVTAQRKMRAWRGLQNWGPETKQWRNFSSGVFPSSRFSLCAIRHRWKTSATKMAVSDWRAGPSRTCNILLSHPFLLLSPTMLSLPLNIFHLPSFLVFLLLSLFSPSVPSSINLLSPPWSSFCITMACSIISAQLLARTVGLVVGGFLVHLNTKSTLWCIKFRVRFLQFVVHGTHDSSVARAMKFLFMTNRSVR